MTANNNAINATQVSIRNGIVDIGGSKIKCLSTHMFFVANRLPIARILVGADVAQEGTGTKYPTTTKEIYDILASKQRGVPVTLTYTLNAEADKEAGRKAVNNVETVMFKGVLDGWSPEWLTSGTLQHMTVWAFHPLALLDWTSIITDRTHGAGFDDYAVTATTGISEEVVPYMLGGYSAAAVTTDLWKGIIKPELIRLCRESRLGVVNTQAAEYLVNEANDKSEQPLSMKVTNPAKVVLDIRRRLMTAGEGRRTLWDALINIAEAYKFSVIGRAQDFSVAPTIAALNGTPSFKLTAQQVVQRNEYTSLAKALNSSAVCFRGAGSHSGFFDLLTKKRSSTGIVKAGQPVPFCLLGESLPGVFNFRMEPFLRTADTLGLRSTKLMAAGYSVTTSEPVADTLNTQYNAEVSEGQAYAKLVYNDTVYSGMTGVLQAAVLFDLCPGSLVCSEAPGYTVPPGTNGEVKKLYGNLWGLFIALDSRETKSQSLMVLSHVRYDNEQASVELSRHPLYDKRWVRAPIVPIAGYTKEAEYA